MPISTFELLLSLQRAYSVHRELINVFSAEASHLVVSDSDASDRWRTLPAAAVLRARQASAEDDHGFSRCAATA